MTILLRLAREAARYRNWMLLSALMGFITVGSSVGLLMTSAYIISKAALHPSIAELQVAIVGVRFFGISRGIFRYLERLLSHETTFRILSHLRVWFYKSLEPLAPARILHFRSSDLFARILNDINELENLYTRVFAPPLISLLTVLLMWPLLGLFHWKFAICLFVFHLCAGIVIPFFVYRLSKITGRQIVEMRARLNTHVIDGLQGLGELIVFGRARSHFDRMADINDKLQKAQRKMAVQSSLYENAIGLLMFTAVTVLFLLAIPLVETGELKGVYLAVIALGIMASFEPFAALPGAAQHLESNERAGRRLFEIIDAQPAVSFSKEQRPFPRFFDIKIEDLSFTYDGQSRPAVKDIDIHVKEGERIAIVGPSGAGKSTLTSLLLRFWDYDRGRILIGEQPLNYLNESQLRKLFAVVAQHTYLFAGTFYDNLLHANPDASASDIDTVLRQIRMDDFVRSLPDGMETWIGEQGLTISGGQRQRLAVGRALLKQSPILLLDEPTANLDAITEQSVLDQIWQLERNRTIILITHRLHGLHNVDQIYVMREGRIIERGTHQQLLEMNGFYHDMYQLQQSGPQAVSDVWKYL